MDCPICLNVTTSCLTETQLQFYVCFDCNYITETKKIDISFIRNCYEEAFPEEYEQEEDSGG